MGGVRLKSTATTVRAAAGPAEAKRPYPGALIVVEGIDGSGKSTQLYLLKRWLELGGYRLYFTEWNSSPLVKSATRRGKKQRLLTPTTFSLLHAADLADRVETQILPLLHSGYLVLADRYIYTAFARDTARGCHEEWLRKLYAFAPVPDLAFYFRSPLDTAVGRILSGRPKLKFYEAGMDLGLAYDRVESFRLFQGKIMDRYERMVDRDRFVVMDGTLPLNELQEKMRGIVRARVNLEEYRTQR
jgi:dTMP kinase